ncbi:L,D-transpeptidase family protein [Mongoliitalea daihaiensis]|uniref:L,D-transpeptidase family protein n=1 Tax=Mongoliitalea daihaiensis TaxID=2782006 RepID=UPI001F0287D5|nr:L,D-transpeptidase family protein [Mongoliitalea daihaiensis]UJP63354.1 L,D-transpeptidase family protein [Mongoliitalea daihaiensis]
MYRALLILFLLVGHLSVAQQVMNFSPPQDFLIRQLIESSQNEKKPKVVGRSLYSSVVIQNFYQHRDFEFAWSNGKKLFEIAYEMRYEIQQAKFDGLNPQDYHLDAINELFDQLERIQKLGLAVDPMALASVDILLTDAFILLSSHLYLGKVDPENLKTTWNIQRNAPELRIDQRLSDALTGGSIRKSLEELYPQLSIYRRMRDGLRETYALEQKALEAATTSWKSIKADKSIKIGDTHNSIPEIRERLRIWGFLKNQEVLENEKTYDSLLIPAIKQIQKRFGLENDGIIGQGTIYALNQSPTALTQTAAVNLERMRWLPHEIKEQELIIVNTANFQLDYLVNRDTLLSSRVIVGKSYHSTPQFKAEMSYLVFSPTWTVPTSITRNEIIPAVKRNNNYLREKNMKILNNSGASVDPSSIEWSKVNPRNFPYTIRQEPGQQNSLGLVKFMFPNKYAVYIHDTPSRSLFAREDRALSHGCIRIQKPFELAKILLSYDESWTDDRIRLAMNQTTERTVTLNRKIPVVIFYLTYWANSRGEYFFRQDIYSRDQEIWTALREVR